MKKLEASTKNSIKEFSIDAVKDFEGCASALKFLKQKYGDRIDDLSNCKAEVIELIVKDKKPDWAINFLLNLMKPKHRTEFYSQYLIQATAHLQDEEVGNDIKKILKSFSKDTTEDQYEKMSVKLQVHLIPVISELMLYKDPLVVAPHEDIIHALQYEKCVLESILFYIDDPKRKFTRSITDALMKLAESKCCLDIVQYKYEDVLQNIALELVEFTGLWK